MALVSLSDQPKFAVRKIYDTDDVAYQDGGNNAGLTCNAPHAIQYNDVAASTTIVIQGKTHIDADWAGIETISGVADSAIYEFPTRYNYVRIIRTAGTGTIVVYAQG